MAQAGRLIGKISSFVVAGLAFAAAIIVGLIPYSEGGYSSLCPSAIQGLTGGTTAAQGWVNMLSGGRCTTYTSTMTTIMFVLLAVAVIALVAGIMIRRRKAAAYMGQGYAPAGYPADAADPAGYAAPAMPGHAPVTPATHNTSTGYPATTTAIGSGTLPAAVRNFDTGLAVRAVALIAGIVLVSYAVQWLSFLPGIVQLLIWTAAGLAIIWQLKRRAAGTDPVKLAEAEAWNPAVVARNTVAWGRNQVDLYRSGSQAVRPTGPAPSAAPPAAGPVQHPSDAVH